MRVSVTGAAGFVGRAAVRAALDRGHAPVAVVRDPPPPASFPEGVEVRVVGDLGDPAAQVRAVEGCDAVLHLAACLRVRRGERRRAAEAFHRVNAVMTAELARAAAGANCRRFVLASSIKVFRSTTPSGVTLGDDAVPRPDTPYGASKLAAEQQLAAVALDTGLSTVSLRPPAIYGPGAGATQLRLLMRGIARGLPFPVSGLKNRRSFIYVGNFADAAVAAAEGRATGAFIVTDSEPISTAELVERVARTMGVSPRLVPAPAGLMRAGARLAGLGSLADSLLGSMAVDGARFAATTGWLPVHSLDAALALTVRDLNSGI